MVGIIYLGFSKAFNKVPDGKSFLKLEKIGMHRGTVEWETAERKRTAGSNGKENHCAEGETGMKFLQDQF